MVNKKTTRKIIAIVLFGIAFLILIVFLHINNINKDCRLKCTNGEYIPCNTSEDCSFESMSAFCGGTKNVILKSGLTGYCSKGYCYSYGCGGVPSID